MESAEVPVLYEVPGKAAGGAAGGRVFGDAIVFAEHASGEIIPLLVRLGAVDEDVLGLRALHQLEVPLSIHPATLEGAKVVQRDYDGGEDLEDLLHGVTAVEVVYREAEHARGPGGLKGYSKGRR